MSTADPAGPLVSEFGAVDLRPSPAVIGDIQPGPVVLSGADDLVELRAIVERVTGPATWPVPDSGAPSGTELRGRVDVERPAAAMALVVALEGLIDDRSAMWRIWKTSVEAIAVGVGSLRSLTLHAVVIDHRDVGDHLAAT